MDCKIIENRVYTSLSKRNLFDLVQACIDNNGRATLCRRLSSGVELVVNVEDDATHYKGRTPGPGNRK